MANNPLSLFTAADWKGLNLFEYGHDEALESALVLFDMDTLNQGNLDFRNVQPKRIAFKQTVTENGDTLEWYDSDTKEAHLTISSFDCQDSDTLQFEVGTVSGSAVQEGEYLFNRNTEVTYLVTDISGSVITSNTPDTNASKDDVLVRLWFSKTYDSDDGYNYTRQDSVQMSNYFEFTEQQITSDMITNNRNGLFYQTQQERLQAEFKDSSAKIVSQMVRSMYVGVKDKYNTGSGSRYRSGGINDFLSSSYKHNIYNSDIDVVKSNFRDVITKASQSGLEMKDQTRLILCTTKFKQKIADLYDNNIRYVDELSSVGITVDEVDLVGYRARLVESNVLNNVYGDQAVAFLVPIDYLYLHVLPKWVSDDQANVQNFGKGVTYLKPQNTFESSTLALGTNFSYMFGGINSGGYRKITYPDS